MTRKVAIVGGGVIGGGWTARFVLNGWDVAVFDSEPRGAAQGGRGVACAFRHNGTKVGKRHSRKLPRGLE